MSRKESKRLRFKIFDRDNFTCQYCGAKAPDVNLELDHIVPLSKGGEDIESNFTTSCYACNRGKSDMLLKSSISNQTVQEDEYKKELLETKINKLLNSFKYSVKMSTWVYCYRGAINEYTIPMFKEDLQEILGLDVDDLRIVFYDLLQIYKFEVVMKATNIIYSYSDIDECHSGIFTPKMISKDLKKAMIGFIKADFDLYKAEKNLLFGLARYRFKINRTQFFSSIKRAEDNLKIDNGEIINTIVLKIIINCAENKKELIDWLTSYTNEKYIINGFSILSNWRKFYQSMEKLTPYLLEYTLDENWRRAL